MLRYVSKNMNVVFKNDHKDLYSRLIVPVHTKLHFSLLDIITPDYVHQPHTLNMFLLILEYFN